MSRPLRIEFDGALYHITSQGDRQGPIYEDDEDRHTFLDVLGSVVKRFRWICHAYCLVMSRWQRPAREPPRLNRISFTLRLN